jgi:hypothetical protein
MTAATFADGDCTAAAVGVLHMLAAAAEDPDSALELMTFDARRLARALALLIPRRADGKVPLSTRTLDLRILDAAMNATTNGCCCACCHSHSCFETCDLRVARSVVPGLDGLCKRFESSLQVQGLMPTVASPTGSTASPGGELATAGGQLQAVPASAKLGGAAVVVAHALRARFLALRAKPGRGGLWADAIVATHRAMNLWTPEKHLTLRGEEYEHYLCADRLHLALFPPPACPFEEEAPRIKEEACIECTYCHRNLPQSCFDGLSGAASADTAAARRGAGACATGEVTTADLQQPRAEKCAGCLRIDVSPSCK